ncbi:MAG: DEAD/DEAH box helicase [Candidatus Hydrogenedentes bacterium]|nr:DEAD/DEAH box helicase [Candidatus Hydrogenedentota bacterium]
MSFHDFDIPEPCLRVLNEKGITDPTPIQAKTFEAASRGDDILGIAQTGTGKTLAFGLPAVCELSRYKPGPGRMLVLTPTRELAIQVHEVIEPLAKAMKLRSTCVYGGVGMQPQINALRRGADIIIATPGRLLDHIQQRTVRFDKLSILVFDEADRMLDMGFLPDIRRIVSVLPRDRQTLLFSATFADEMARVSREFQREPKRIEVGAVFRPVDAVTQHLYTVRNDDKTQLLIDLLGESNVDSAIVFIRAKYRADRIAKMLRKHGFKSQPIHGGRTQGQRQRALDEFKSGKCNILVATDVAARGIDIQGVTHVFNFDVPGQYDDYVHRIGRTARNQATGDAITFVTPEDTKELANLERGMGKRFDEVDWSGAVDVERTFRVREQGESTRKPRGGGNGRNRGRGNAPAQASSNGNGGGNGHAAPSGGRRRSRRGRRGAQVA